MKQKGFTFLKDQTLQTLNLLYYKRKIYLCQIKSMTMVEKEYNRLKLLLVKKQLTGRAFFVPNDELKRAPPILPEAEMPIV